jgi:hypothetical protein
LQLPNLGRTKGDCHVEHSIRQSNLRCDHVENLWLRWVTKKMEGDIHGTNDRKAHIVHHSPAVAETLTLRKTGWCKVKHSSKHQRPVDELK